ncbi:MAG: cell division protein CrgA [Acidimicrobiia bacterium]|nr:cell division protein CrgA [Acidimicrobiia bacterium]
MGKPPKRRVQGGRVTAKGTTPESTRYTPPGVYSQQKVSPGWVPVLMFGLLGIGVVIILANYVGFVPGDTSNWYLLLGLGFILSGIITATQFH